MKFALSTSLNFVAFPLEGQLEFNTGTSSFFGGMNENLLLLPSPSLPSHMCTHFTSILETKNWVQLLFSSQESQNDSYTFTQLSIKGDYTLLVKFQSGERAHNSSSDGVLGKPFLQGGKVINLQLVCLKASAFI